MLCPSCRAENDDQARLCVACRTPLRVIAAGSMVAGRYEIEKTLGRGGMGTVYRARDRVLDETVALKILRADLAGTPGMAARFRSEIKLARRVAHPNVCRIYEYGEEDGLQFISMELVEGANLKERLAREGPPPPERAFALAAQVADGLEAVHGAGIVHRDLKSANIMVDGKGAVRVMDFGIARAAAPDAPGETTGYVLGSPEYMSPEQARGRPADFRSDVYSLGVVVYELFSGRVPFRADTPVATLLMHLESEPPLSGPGAPALPSTLVPVLARALAKDAGARYATAGDMAAALRAARDDTVFVPDPVRASRWSPRQAPRREATLAVAAILFLAAAAVATWQVARRPAGGVEASPAPVTGASPVASASPSYALVPEPPASAAPTATPVATPPPAAPAVRVPPPGTTAAISPSPAPATPTPAPSPAPVVAAPAATPTPAPEPRPPPGALLVLARPWASVTVDGVVIGDTPMKAFPLAAGSHDVVLTHPDYQPYRRRVTLRPGETFRLTVNFPTDGVRRR
jgi:serine/threonine-protein kinase